MQKPKLFLLHFAGGNCYSFQPLAALLNEFDVIPLELPGRGRRLEEDLLRDFDLAALDYYQQIVNKLTSSIFFIYGHSMGAYLALRVSNLLANNEMSPALLFVSGNAGPGVRENRGTYLLERAAFINELIRLGGVRKEFVNDEELFDFFEPILRADFEIVERNEIKMEPPVSCPLFAMMGSDEDEVEKITNWAGFTKSWFDYRILDGDHFFIDKYPDQIAQIIHLNCETVRSQKGSEVDNKK
jgi:surfactin synthase thioesterase subunit